MQAGIDGPDRLGRARHVAGSEAVEHDDVA